MAFRFGSRVARRALAGVAVAGVALLSACGGDSTGSGGGTTYALTSIDGQALPFSYDDGFGTTTTVKSGSLVLKSGNKFSFLIRGSDQTTGQPLVNWSEGANGTYTVNGNVYTFTTTQYVFDGVTEPADPADIVTGTLSGNTITVDDDGTVLVFTKS